MLAFFSGITFGGVQIGIAVMQMAEPADDDPFGGRRDGVPTPQAELQAILVPIEERPRTHPR
ncbi:MAG: hypothetical protein JKP98_15220 [Rhodobacteraceae bacterium]|nr:hypothetical protein [Paracoccaceae bacterium]